jgi:hypothetical protein
MTGRMQLPRPGSFHFLSAAGGTPCDRSRRFRCSLCPKGWRLVTTEALLTDCVVCGRGQEEAADRQLLEIETHLENFVSEMKAAVNEASEADLEEIVGFYRSPPLMEEVLAPGHFLLFHLHVVRAKLWLRLGRAKEAEAEWQLLADRQRLVENSSNCVAAVVSDGRGRDVQSQ